VLVEGAGGGPTALSWEQPILLNQPFVADSGASKKELVSNVVTCCCFSQGTSKITSYFEKNTYVPGETAYMISEVDNSESKVNIRSIAGSVEKRVKLAAGPYEDFIHKTVNSISIGGIMAGQSLLGGNAKRIEVVLQDTDRSSLVPTCGGTIVENAYYLENTIHLDVGCCTSPDHLSCRLNVIIRNADEYTFSWRDQPSTWMPTLHQVYSAQFLQEYAGPLGSKYHSTEEIIDIKTEILYQPPAHSPAAFPHNDHHHINTSLTADSPPPPYKPHDEPGFPSEAGFPSETHQPVMPAFPSDDTPFMPAFPSDDTPTMPAFPSDDTPSMPDFD
jgi:hypothetical protein